MLYEADSRQLEEQPTRAAMWFGEFENAKACDRTCKRIGELGLEKHVSELDSDGFTVVPPDKVAERACLERLREAVLRICRQRTGVDFQLDRNGAFGRYEAQPQAPGQFLLYYLLMADPVFERWVLNPTLYALIDYLLRGWQQLSSLHSFVKWKGERPSLRLHTDCPADPDGRLPAYAAVANSAYCLTDYTLEGGAIAMVPGSHAWRRPPNCGEGEDAAVPVEAEAGSLIVWHGNTWHGAFEKKTDGLRLNVTSFFCHRNLKNEENYQWRVTPEMLERNPPAFAKLVGADDWLGWDERGPDYSRPARYGSAEDRQRYLGMRRRVAMRRLAEGQREPDAPANGA